MKEVPEGKHCLNSKTGVKCPYYCWFGKEQFIDKYACYNPDYAPYFPKGRLIKGKEFIYKKQECLDNTNKK